VLEGVPDVVAQRITAAVPVPTIGIGAGRHCDGQVLVFHDVLGLQDGIRPKFVRRYASLKAEGTEAVAAFAVDVRKGAFPAEEETYHLPAATAAALSDGDTDVAGLYGSGPAAAAN
jgi:3-methyl-2-oxobutanoate hydroxymethyltransferase